MHRKTVLITGASSGIGMNIAKKLCHMGYEVYGIGRDFSHTERELLEFDSFHKIECDLLDTAELLQVVKDLRGHCKVDVLINNAGCAYYGLHEELNTSKIQQMVRTNLEVPMVLTQLLLRDLKESHGTIINISSVTARATANPHGAAYGATKAGLLSFGSSIFEEARKHGVRVTTIMPDMTDTNLYRNADFEADTSDGASLSPGDVSDAVEFVLTRGEGVTVPELMLRPQYHRISRKKEE